MRGFSSEEKLVESALIKELKNLTVLQELSRHFAL